MLLQFVVYDCRTRGMSYTTTGNFLYQFKRRNFGADQLKSPSRIYYEPYYSQYSQSHTILLEEFLSASITDASTKKLNMIFVSFIVAMSRWLYFSTPDPYFCIVDVVPFLESKS